MNPNNPNALKTILLGILILLSFLDSSDSACPLK